MPALTETEFKHHVKTLIRGKNYSRAKKLMKRHLKVSRQREHSFVVESDVTMDGIIFEDSQPSGIRRERMIEFFNSVSKDIRQGEYNLKISDRNFEGIRVVTEGDSWFQYPVLLRDVIDHVMAHRKIACFSLGGAMHLVKDMYEHGEYIDAIEEIKPAAFLLSGGGNDILGDGNLGTFLHHYNGQTRAEDFIKSDKMNEALNRVVHYHDLMIGKATRASRTRRKLKVYGHSYAYAIPRQRNKWLFKPMQKKNIPTQFRRDIVKHLIDGLHRKLKSLETKHSNYKLIDVRRRVGTSTRDWDDELHPKDEGFGRVARKFTKELEYLRPQSFTDQHKNIDFWGSESDTIDP